MNKNIFWELVKELDWPNMCKLQNKKRYSLAQEIFKKMKLTNDDIIEAKHYAKAFREILQDKVKEYSLLKYGDKYAFLNNSKVLSVSDDGFWDLCAHIVGCGEKVYNKVLNNPKLILKFPDYVENFEYVFDTYTEYTKEKEKSN